MRILTSLDAVALLAVAALAAIVVIPQRKVRWMIRNEDRIVADLRTIETRLQEHQRAARLDADGDGVGEYAPLADVFGDDAGEARRVGSSAVWELHGYRFTVLVPGGRKLPVVAGAGEAVADWAEVTYGVIAWPARRGETGMLAYMATPHGLLRHTIDGYPYEADPPIPDWTMIDLSGERPRRAAYTGSDWRVPVHLPAHSDSDGAAPRQR